MNQNDCVIIDVINGVECPMCGNRISEKNMVKTCSKNPDHCVCSCCMVDLKTNGYGDGCVYCGYRSEKEKNIIIARAPDTRLHRNNVVIVQTPADRIFVCNCRIDDLCLIFCSILLLVIIIVSIYCLGVIMFSVGQQIEHKLDGEDHTHKTEWSLENCAKGYLGWLIVVYIIFQVYLLMDVTYEKCCLPCGKKLRSLMCFSRRSNRVSTDA